MRHRHVTLSTFIMISLSIACNRHSTESPFTPSSAQGLDVQDIARSASTADSEGTRRDGSAPASGAGPHITTSGNQSIVNGGTLAVTIQASSPFVGIYMFVAGKTLGLAAEAAGGVEGYYDLRLPSARTSASVLLTFPQTIPLNEFELLFAVADAAGAVGPYSGLPVRVTQVGTGDVQVTLSWDTDSDVDLHVVDPSGAEIYYGQLTSASGGELDLDSNAACAIDGIRNENVTWPVGRAPSGPYTVRVDYWDNCGVGETNFTIRINNGGAAQIVSGSFTGTGDAGGVGSGRTVATFERQSGPSALAPGGAPSAARPEGAQRYATPAGGGKKLRAETRHAPN